MTIRVARDDDLPLLPAIDASGGPLFRGAGMDLVADMPPDPPEAFEPALAAGTLWVTADEDDRPVGFVRVGLVDGHPHVDQLSVHPDQAGQRLGARLLEAAETWARSAGHAEMSLTTYRDVPWNGPYYERLGWRVLPVASLGPGLAAARQHERDRGLDRWPRQAMVKDLAPGPGGRPVLTTPRVTLRPMTLEHLPLLHRLDADPEVMRHLLGRARTPEEIDAFWAPRCADPSGDALGLGWWVGFAGAGAGADFLGWWDLGRRDSEPGSPVRPDAAEIGWRLDRRYWRRGLASEGAAALVRHGFETVGLRRIWAETMAVNAASRGVMRRLGMRHVSTEVRAWDDPLPGAEEGEVTYEITAEEWRRGLR
ncbi:GNAT family N-acetyltransferase [Arsenicicoccus cauae]|nr:GNAT family N-acetyltransferase [Arsenicicoccus cauae]